MKKINICLTLLFIPFLSKGQSKIVYTYDATGNRIGREIIMQALKAKASSQTFDTEGQVFSDMLHEHDIKIYPNPTRGFLKVCVYGLKNTDKCSMSLYTTQGTQIMAYDVSEESFEINISNQPGWHLHA